MSKILDFEEPFLRARTHALIDKSPGKIIPWTDVGRLSERDKALHCHCGYMSFLIIQGEECTIECAGCHCIVENLSWFEHEPTKPAA